MTKRLLVPALLLLLAPLTIPLHADTIVTDDIPKSGVTVEGFADGKLLVIMPSGEHRYDLKEVQGLTLDRVAKFNDAEAAAKNSDWTKASRLYTESLTQTNDKKVQVAIKARAIPAHDNAGNFKDALSCYIDVLSAGVSSAALALRPQKLPDAKSQYIAESETLINAHLKDRTLQDADAQKSLKSILLHLYIQSHDQRAAALAKEIGEGIPADASAPQEKPAVAGNGHSPAPAAHNTPESTTPDAAPAPEPAGANDAEIRAATSAVKMALEAKRYDDVITLGDKALEGNDGAAAIEIYQAKAQAYLAQKKLPEAAMAYIRIAVTYPTSGDAADAMLQAAKIQKELKNDAEAKHLLEDLIEKHPNTAATVEAKTLLQ